MTVTLSYDEIVELSGIKIPFVKSAFAENVSKAIRAGWYEHKEAKEIPRIVQPNERILELGAGIGFISTLAAKNPLTEAVLVYEANPELIPIIKKVHELNGISNVDVVNAVLSDNIPGKTATFYLRKEFWASSLQNAPWKFRATTEVPVHGLSETIRAFRPTLIICDIEGGEIDLFEKADLTGVKKIYLELHQNVVGRRGMKRIFDCMSSKDFHYDQHHSSGPVVLFSHVDR